MENHISFSYLRSKSDKNKADSDEPTAYSSNISVLLFFKMRLIFLFLSNISLLLYSVVFLLLLSCNFVWCLNVEFVRTGGVYQFSSQTRSS